LNEELGHGYSLPSSQKPAIIPWIILIHVRFQVLTAMSMKFRVFWDVMPCSQVDVDRRFRGVYWLHHGPLNNFWTDWWIWMKSCLEVKTLKMTSTPY
jgi:hypothetical protein